MDYAGARRAVPNLGLTDAKWDLIDPNPDVHALFSYFGMVFFDNKLTSVQLEWSKKMTSCAGICYFHPKNGLCLIRLSEPLLKLRPRGDLIETLLHEMIHALLFVTSNNRDREAHGPEFQEHMHRINAQSGTNITIYHTFHDEVDSYKVHVWKCDGPCRMQHPFYGVVRRTMNRAPSKNDLWWSKHEMLCGGTFVKIAGPKTRAELMAEKKKAEEKKPTNEKDIASYFPYLNENKIHTFTFVDDGASNMPVKIDPMSKNSVQEDISKYFPVENGNYTIPAAPLPNPEVENKKVENLGNKRIKIASPNNWFAKNVVKLESQEINNNKGSKRGMSDGPASHLWPGTGIKLGTGTGAIPKNTGPCATVTSGALLAEQQGKFGLSDASCSSQNNQFVPFGAFPKYGDPIYKRDVPKSDPHGEGVFDFAKTSMLETIHNEIVDSLKKRQPTFEIGSIVRRNGFEEAGNSGPPIPPPTMALGNDPVVFLRNNFHKLVHVSCPLCHTQVPAIFINEHLDDKCGLKCLALAADAEKAACFMCGKLQRPADLELHQQQCLDQAFSETVAGTSRCEPLEPRARFPLLCIDREKEDDGDEPTMIKVVTKPIYPTFVECPVCMKQVKQEFINEHLDNCMSK